MINKTICPAPWISATVTPKGVVKPCNNFHSDENFAKESNVNTDFLNSSSWQKLRENMLHEKFVNGCDKCYQKENLNLKSSRKILIDWFGSQQDIKLKFLEIAFSNTCNLACVGCNSKYSSKWAMEDYKNKRSDTINILQSNKLDYKSLDLTNIEVVKLLGGEPLLHQQDFIELLENFDRTKLLLTITTNGTILPNYKLKKLIEECKEVHYYISIDGTEKVNEWYRWPTKSVEVLNNIDTYYHWWKDFKNIGLISHTVINAYNIWDLNDFVEYFNKKYDNWRFDFDWLMHPNWHSISVIPNTHKQIIEQKLNIWADTIKGNFIKNENPFKESIKWLYQKNDATWEDFKNNSFRLSKERNLNLVEHLPLLKNLIEF
jgi:MoaA/NifB/PqqE/SkfB family radical SAM enzyme